MSRTVNRDEAGGLASGLVEAAVNRRSGPVEGPDGVVHVPHLVRDGDRLYQRGEPWAWYDLSAAGAPRTDYDDSKAPDRLRVDEARRVRHQDGSMTTYHGWVEASGGWVLLATDGASWTPMAYVPDDSPTEENVMQTGL